MFTNFKESLGVYVGEYYQKLVPTTPAMDAYLSRGLANAVVWVPSRMVDSVTDMMSAWQRNSTTDAKPRVPADPTKIKKKTSKSPSPTPPADFPVIFVGVSKDYTPSGREFSRQISDEVPVIIPEDPKGRVFKLKILVGDIRVQVVFCATDEPTAKSLAAQFCGYVDSIKTRQFGVDFKLAGFSTLWPAMLESPDMTASLVGAEYSAKNMTILAVDLIFKATVPLLLTPKLEEESDGNGVLGSLDDPPGFKNLTDKAVSINEYELGLWWPMRGSSQ